jgi:hypothetical protein
METSTAETWIYSKLTADAALTALVGSRIYRGVAPEGAAFPFVVFFLMMGTGFDVMGTGTARYITSGQWVIKAVDRNPSASTASSVADRIDAALHGQSGSATGGVVHACTRDEPLAYVEVADGATYQHLGGLYKVFVK